jgi:hypothetical protein
MKSTPKIECGNMIIFDSLLFENRRAFCIDFNENEQIIYRGLFGLKCVPLDVFLNFAKIKEVFGYIEKELSISEKGTLKMYYKYAELLRQFQYKTVDALVKKLYETWGLI